MNSTALPSDPPVKIAVILTCHNRCDKTLRALQCLFENTVPSGLTFQVFVVDDGSTDGTSDAIARVYPQVVVIPGSGSLFWNGGMYAGFAAAIEIGFDAYVWLNDDTELFQNSLAIMLATCRNSTQTPLAACACIVVGSTSDASGAITYGGSVSVGKFRPFNYRKISDPNKPTECDVMNGNCVLIPAEVVRRIGNIDPNFEHSMGDIDYALRARSAGCRVVVAPGVLGYCEGNATAVAFRDKNLSRTARLKEITSRKVLPPRSWMRLTRRHGGPLWPAYFAWPYIRTLLL